MIHTQERLTLSHTHTQVRCEKVRFAQARLHRPPASRADQARLHRQDSDGCTSLILAIGKEHEAAAGVLVPPLTPTPSKCRWSARQESRAEWVYVVQDVELDWRGV